MYHLLFTNGLHQSIQAMEYSQSAFEIVILKASIINEYSHYQTLDDKFIPNHLRS